MRLPAKLVNLDDRPDRCTYSSLIVDFEDEEDYLISKLASAERVARLWRPDKQLANSRFAVRRAPAAMPAAAADN